MLIESSPTFLAEAKEYSQSEFEKGQNIFVDFYFYLLQRISNCSNFCPICDQQQPVEGIKPVVCEKKDCVWRYEELGLGASVNSEILYHPEVVDLLISMFYSGFFFFKKENINFFISSCLFF